MPVYELLGGRRRDKMGSYEAVFYYMPEKMAEFCMNLEQKRYDAVRLMIIGDITRTQAGRSSDIYGDRMEGYIKRVRACRETVGRDFDLIPECHRSMNPCEAIAFAEGVEIYRPLFLEDPIPPDDSETMANVAKGTGIPVAIGERFTNTQGFETTLQERAARYLKPDICTPGGPTLSKKVAAMAETNYAKVVLHNPLGLVPTAACLRLDATTLDSTIQKFPSLYHQGNEARMAIELFREEDGYIVIPDASRTGIELTESLTGKFPPGQRSISTQTAYDDGVYDVQWNGLPEFPYYNSRQRTS